MFRNAHLFFAAMLFSPVLAFCGPFSGGEACAAPQELAGDFNEDGFRDETDVNLLTESGDLTEGYKADGTPFDINGNGKVDLHDLQGWLELGTVNSDPKLDNGGTIMGDANLDGIVDREDETIILESFGTATDKYTKGDVNGSGEVDGIDLLIYVRALFFQKRKGG